MLKKFKTLAKDWVDDRRRKFPKNRNFRALTMCENCYAFYYKNSWNLQKPMYLNEYHEEEIPVFFTKCSACLEQEEALFERESNFILGSGQMV